MIKLGKKQRLIVQNIQREGAYLNTKKAEDRNVLLSKDEMPKGLSTGDSIEVMVYINPDNKIVATTKEAKGEVGDIVKLPVVSQTRIGIFLDWGLDKDLFLPFSETFGRVTEGQHYLVAIYLDSSNRLCATMKLQKYLSTDSPYKENDTVSGTIYSINHDIGAFVAVDDKYNGLIPKEELIGAYKIGDTIDARVFNVKDDGKLDLSLRGPAHLEMASDVNNILDKLKANNGFLPFNDKSSPDSIKKEFGISKGAFKRATGNLYKEQMIIWTDGGIKLI